MNRAGLADIEAETQLFRQSKTKEVEKLKGIGKD